VKRRRPFLVVWALAVAAATSAFTLYLALRMRSIEIGYELGRAHQHLGRLREVKRVLELELSSHETPERVDLVARAVLGMSEPSPDRMLPGGAPPAAGERSGLPSEDGVPRKESAKP
jgi:cell division protein FtsL